MDSDADSLQKQLIVCRSILNKGYTNIQITRLPWLNTFCLEFYKFSKKLHTFLSLFDEQQKHDKSDHIEVIYLCLTQIVTCIKHMENTIKAEQQHGAAISASRQHFLDRIHWCLGRLRSCMNSVSSPVNKKATLPEEEKSFVDLMDGVLDILALYSSYKDETNITKNINVAEGRAQALFDSQEIRSYIDLLLGHTLAFANVALQQDKMALSAFCQKVLRVCMEFQEECTNSMLPGAPLNDSNRKLKAISLENALYQLEDYINEALLRLVFTCFLDFKKFSIEILRKEIEERQTDDPQLDELIADFDVNVDRTTQIGIFAISFAPNVKIKTIVRSCLASFESLDSCIIPSLQTKGYAGIFSNILEKHFNEEVKIFKNSILEIIDTQAFASSYLELLTQAIQLNDKEYNKQSLEDIIEMAGFLYEHFQLPVNYQLIQKEEQRLNLFKKFHLMLQECQAALKCANLKLEPLRVLKRFKVLRSVLRKLIDEISDKSASELENKSQDFLLPDELADDSQEMFATLNITPFIRSILYNNNSTKQKHRRKNLLNDSNKINFSQIPSTSAPALVSEPQDQEVAKAVAPQRAEPQHRNTAKSFPINTLQHGSIRRKESLRTALFKRQKSNETQQIYNVYKNNSDSLQISEILDQLTGLSSNLSELPLDKSFIS